MNYLNFKLVDLNAQNNAGIDKSRLAGICFSNVYVLELLAKYGFTSIGNVQVVDKVIKFKSTSYIFLSKFYF